MLWIQWQYKFYELRSIKLLQSNLLTFFFFFFFGNSIWELITVFAPDAQTLSISLSTDLDFILYLFKFCFLSFIYFSMDLKYNALITGTEITHVSIGAWDRKWFVGHEVRYLSKCYKQFCPFHSGEQTSIFIIKLRIRSRLGSESHSISLQLSENKTKEKCNETGEYLFHSELERFVSVSQYNINIDKYTYRPEECATPSNCRIYLNRKTHAKIQFFILYSSFRFVPFHISSLVHWQMDEL